MQLDAQSTDSPFDRRVERAIQETNVDLASSGLSLEIQSSFAEGCRISLRDCGRPLSDSGPQAHLRLTGDLLETHLLVEGATLPVGQILALSEAGPSQLYDHMAAMAEAILARRS